MISPNDPRLGDRNALALRLAEAARLSGAVLLAMRSASDVRVKADGSPVCSADMAADHTAKQALVRLLPDFPVVSEESVEAVEAAPVFILLDPLDGTREFLAAGGSYCVAIAIIREGRPIAGAIVAPELGRLWFSGEDAFSQRVAADGTALGEPERIGVRLPPEDGLVTLISRFHADALSEGVLKTMPGHEPMPMSSAVKFGIIAAGEADLHVRGGPTMEWDIAAGDAILTAAGGVVRLLDGQLPRYGRPGGDFRNPPFVAASSEALAQRAIAAANTLPANSLPRS
ncbi:3'(2'),5'-bisphosphate nucleotidase CysQ family protein [Bosea caraganae]|nr:3'(2'),5'-bisphosphate nucleotidase CysQ [Bosea caraganae]